MAKLKWFYVIIIADLTYKFGAVFAISDNRTNISFIPDNYDKDVVPRERSSIPVKVYLYPNVLSIAQIKEDSKQWTVEIRLSARWTDRSLRFVNKNPNATFINLSPDQFDKLWSPKLYFDDSLRGGYLHSVTTSNIHYRFMKENNTVRYTARYTIPFHCNFDLKYFPFDVQSCSIKTSSFKYRKDQVNLVFENLRTNAEFENSLPQYEVEKFDPIDCRKYWITGNYPCLEVRITWSRNYRYHVIQVFAPSAIVVFLSWLSFWHDIGAIAARLTLGVYTFLTLITQFLQINSEFKSVSYIKAMDVWFLGCLILILASVMESTLAYNIYSERKDEETRKRNKELANRIDRLSRMVFPSVFVGFVAAYYTIYVGQIKL